MGRGAEADWLRRGLEAAVAGQPRVVLVAGEAGIGKTRLVQEFEALAAARRVWRCHGRAYEGLRLPYQLFVEILQDQLADVPEAVERVLGSDAARISALVRPKESLAELRLPHDDVEHHPSRMGLFVAVSRATIELARVRPTVLLLEDLHWADEASLQQLSHLVFAVGEAALRAPVPLLVVVTHRPPEAGSALEQIVARLSRETICSTLDVSELDEDRVGELVTGLGVAKPARQLVTGLRAMTGGNPLFVKELVDELRRRDLLQERGGYQTTSKPLDELDLPVSLDVAIRAGTAKIGKRCSELLALAACFGDRIAAGSLVDVTGSSEDAVLEQLEEAWRHELLISTGDAFEFRHPLIRQAFYTSMSSARRQRTHLRIAEHLEARRGDARAADVLEIAHHLDRAGTAADREKLAQAAGAAGDVAFQRLAWADAARFYDTALDVSEELGRLTPGERATLQFRAGLAHYRNMDAGPCRDRFDQAIEGFRSQGDVAGAAKVLVERTRARLTQGETGYGETIDTSLLEESLEALPESETVLRGSVATMLSEAHLTGRDSERAEAMARRGLELAAESRDDRLHAHAFVTLGLAQMQQARLREARESFAEGLDCARRTGDPWVEGWPLQRLPLVLIGLGELARAERRAQQACENSRVTQDWAEYSLGLAALTEIAVARGDFEAAEDFAQQTLSMARRSSYPWGAAVALPALASGQAQLGARARAEEALDRLVEPGGLAESGGGAFAILAQVFRQLLAARAGRLDPASEPLTIKLLAASLPAEPDFNLLSLLCAGIETASLVGDEPLVERCYTLLAPAAAQGVVFSGGWLYLVPRMLGVAAARLGRHESAEEHFGEASRAATQASAHPELVRTRLDHARMLADRDARGDRDRAVELLERAEPLLEEHGMEGCADEAIQLATRLDVRLFGSAGSGVAAARARTEALREAPAAEPAPLTLLITDMESFTPLVERLGDEQAQAVIHAHNVILRACLRAYRGREIQHTGDGMITAFESPTSAVDCAVAMQRDTTHHSAQHPETRIRVRIGVHVGRARAEEDRLFGAVVNATSRISARAEPTQILISQAVRDGLGEYRFELDDRGRVPLKGFKEPFQLYEVKWQG